MVSIIVWFFVFLLCFIGSMYVLDGQLTLAANRKAYRLLMNETLLIPAIIPPRYAWVRYRSACGKQRIRRYRFD